MEKWVRNDVKDGYFVKEGSDWIEYLNGSHYASYKEIKRA